MYMTQDQDMEFIEKWRDLHPQNLQMPMQKKISQTTLPPFIIENSDKSLSYVPDQVAEDPSEQFNHIFEYMWSKSNPCRCENSNARRLPKHSCPSTRNYRWSKQQFCGFNYWLLANNRLYWHHPSSRKCMPDWDIRLFRILNIFNNYPNYPCWTLTRKVKLQHY